MYDFARFMGVLNRRLDQVMSSMNQVQAIYREMQKMTPLFKELSGFVQSRATTLGQRAGKRNTRTRRYEGAKKRQRQRRQ